MSDPTQTPHPSGSPLPELARAITSGAVRLAAATAAWLRLIAEFDEREGWAGYGIKSCAQWLAWQCALAPGAAREHVRVARALRELPLIEAAFAEGRLSYSKVRALTRIAAPDCQQMLLTLAQDATAAQLERFTRGWRRADAPDADPADTAERLEQRQSWRHWWDDDGMLVLQVRMRSEPGMELITAVESLAEREARRERAQNKRARDAEPARHPDARPTADWRAEDELARRRAADDELAGLAVQRRTARRLDALAALAGARVELDRRPGDPPRREVIVHVDAAVLADDAAAGRAYYENGPALSAAQARRLLCDATVVTMLEAGREPLALGRKRRRGSKGQRRALLRRDGGCARPGCPETRIERLHVHHMRHWLFGGRTDLDNLVLLCDADHGLAHDLDLVLTRRNGRLIAVTPDGRHVWGPADAAFSTGLLGLDEDQTGGPTGDAQPATAADRWTGVHPVDTEVGRRPVPTPSPEPAPPTASDEPSTPAEPAQPSGTVRHVAHGKALQRPRRADRPGGSARRAFRPAGRPPSGPRRSGRLHDVRSTRTSPATHRARLNAALFPSGEPDLPDTIQHTFDRLQLHWAVGVLMGNREVVRRLAAEAGVAPRG